MVTEGLPLLRQERGTDPGLLAGADFLSVFMQSSDLQSQKESSTAATTSLPESLTFPTKSMSRGTRSTTYVPSLVPNSSVEPSSDGLVVGVSVSSSEGRTHIAGDEENIYETTTLFPDQDFVASEDHPSIVAEANKSEFSVEESDPITTNSFMQEYPASVQILSKEKFQPIQQTVIYHSNPRESTHARSVSYSTVIQAAPQPNLDKTWEDDKHERHERHFENAAFRNSFKADRNNTKWLKADITTEKNWGLPEKNYARNYAMVYGKPEQNYEIDESASVMSNGRLHGIQPSPTVSSLPKQDVKIGESRKTDDNQKVGYVVEGRNYRKYRVEERTSDGFIVGEYGVVSHDDGSLRGVRYTADGTASPRLIYDALMKFLSL